MLPSTSRPCAIALESWPVHALVAAVRHNIDNAKIGELVTSLQTGHELPAVFVLVDGGKVSILDGHHRACAWAVAYGGDFMAPVIVFRPR